MRVQSSIKDTNHLAPEQFGTWEGPHTLEWTKEKGIDENLLLTGNETQWCFEISQTSQWKTLPSKPLNNEGNIVLSKRKGGCPKRKWWSQISSVLGLFCDEQTRLN